MKKKTEARETDEVPSPQDERVQAKIEEIDAQMQYLQQRRKEILTARGEHGGATTDTITSISPDDDLTRGPLESTDRDELKTLEALPWKGFGPGMQGQWTFATDRSGNLMRTLEPAQTFIASLKSRRQVTLGGYRYKISDNGKFLHRFPVNN